MRRFDLLDALGLVAFVVIIAFALRADIHSKERFHRSLKSTFLVDALRVGA